MWNCFLHCHVSIQLTAALHQTGEHSNGVSVFAGVPVQMTTGGGTMLIVTSCRAEQDSGPCVRLFCSHLNSDKQHIVYTQKVLAKKLLNSNSTLSQNRWLRNL